MNDFNRNYAHSMPAGTADMSVDAGLRSFMLGVYNKLGLGLAWAGLIAFLVSSFEPVRQFFFIVQDGVLVGITPLGMAAQWAPLIILFGAMFMMRNPSPRSSGILYWTIVSLLGVLASVWMLIYTGGSVATTFFITATAFGALSLFGYTTKKDLTGMGSFLIMGMFGLIIAMIVNMFLQSAAIMFVISGLGVLIFSGLIAFDTQRLKIMYYQLQGNNEGMAVATNFGALNLFINFFNLMQFLLMFLGMRRD